VEDQVIVDVLRTYVGDQILQDPEVPIERDTPLLEWGLLNSISTTQLVGFIRDHFQIEVPPEEMVGNNFKDLGSISRMLLQLAGQ
jgi:acyl carrier protein